MQVWLGYMIGNEEFSGWELEDDSEGSWSVIFSIGSIPDSLLAMGDRVVVTRSLVVAVGHPDSRGFRGHFAVEKDGTPVIFFANAVLPVFDAVPDFAVEGGELECSRTGCAERRTMRVTMNGETAELAMGETVELGGFVLRSGGFEDTSRCEREDLSNSFLPADYQLAGYAIPQ
jgi:hypothetical protein